MAATGLETKGHLPDRTVSLTRTTRETAIDVDLNIDGKGDSLVSTGFSLLDHYLETLALHGALDLRLKAESQRPDLHHCAEDAGWAIGMAMRRCLELRGDAKEEKSSRQNGQIKRDGDRNQPNPEALSGSRCPAIRRFGSVMIPFDEVLIACAVDLIGRPGFYLSPEDGLGYDDFQEFFKAFTGGAGATLHMQVLRDGNLHHKVECSFKGLGRALRDAVIRDTRVKQMSVKGAVQYVDMPRGF